MSSGSRRADGEPETEADRRFFDLRDSGYMGPIDQDGNKAMAGEATDIRRRIAEVRGETVSW